MDTIELNKRPIVSEKIPDHILLKESRKEVGQLQSYIHELESTNRELAKEVETLLKLDPDERKEMKRERLYGEKNNELRQMREKLKKLSFDYDLLLSRYHNKGKAE